MGGSAAELLVRLFRGGGRKIGTLAVRNPSFSEPRGEIRSSTPLDRVRLGSSFGALWPEGASGGRRKVREFVANQHFIDPQSPFVFPEHHHREQAAAGVLSVGLHVAFIFAIWAMMILIGNGMMAPHSSIHAPVTLARIFWHPTVTEETGGGGGGNQSLSPVSRGVMPLVVVRRPFVPPTLVTNPQAKLQVAPAIEAEAPRILDDQYGDPLSQSGLLSEGSGKRGFGNGLQGWGDGSGPGTGSGNGPGSAVYAWNQVSTRPMLLSKVEPEYSELARQSKFQGTVLLNVIIDDKGFPRDVSISRPLGMGLDEKAMEAVRRWRFKPATKDGKPVAMATIVEVNFRLL